MPIPDKELLLKHYAQKHVQKAMLTLGEDKEVVGSFGGKGYGRRPASLMYPLDIMSLVKQGVTSFHVSEETWVNPWRLETGQEKEANDRLRKGWDLIIDIDCPVFEYSRITAHFIIEALQFHGIKSVSCKFSGNKGFHIGVPFESFPKEIQGKKTEILFPDIPRKIAEYIQEFIDPKEGELKPDTLSGAIASLEKNLSLEDIAQKVGKRSITNSEGRLHAATFVEVDTIALSSRHLIRHVYSVNEKSGLISIPINPKKVLEFERDLADINKFVKSRFSFLDRTNARPHEAQKLLDHIFAKEMTMQPLLLEEHEEQVAQKEYQELDEPVDEQFFPPSIKQILEGLQDGRKRALFVLVNFLRYMNWDQKDIENRVEEWNKQNGTPLKAIEWRGHIRSAFNKKAVLPPNFSHKGYYQELEISTKIETQAGYKNPVTYALRSYRMANPQEKKRESITDEQREKRRVYRAKKKQEKASNSSEGEILV